MSDHDARRATIAARTRALYHLAFHACGCSHRAVQRCIGRDVRSLCAANDVPTLASVIDLSRALGMRPAATVEILLGPAVHRREGETLPMCATADGSAMRSIRARIDDADLADDPCELEHLLHLLPPGHEHLRAAMLARICAARGSIARTIALVGRARAGARDPLVRDLLATAIGEVAIIRPDALDVLDAPDAIAGIEPASSPAPDPVRRPPAQRDRAPVGDIEPRPSLAVRMDFHRCAVATLRGGDTCERLSALHRLADELDRVRERRDHEATAWAASIVELAALALLARGPRDETVAGRFRRIAVLAGFALEDATRCGDPRAERLACARRARTVVTERLVRAACGEDPMALADAADLAELQAATLRFPEADTRLHPFRQHQTFSQQPRSRLDLLASPIRMVGRSRQARGVACMNP